MTTQAKARVELFMKTRDDAIEKYGHLFKPVEGDEKGNELLQRGFDRVDLVFGKKPQKPLTPEQATKLHAMIRNKAGAFDRLNHLHRQAKARINELEAELQQFRDSSPSGGLERRGAKEEGMPSFEQEIDRIASGR